MVPGLLEDEVAGLLAAGRPTTVDLIGGPGLGKTTALAHLAAAFAGSPRLVLVDTGADPVGATAENAVTVRARAQSADDGALPWELVPWTDDDALEYLMSAHPGRVAAAFAGWRAFAQRDQLLHLPALCGRLLDALARSTDDASFAFATLLEVLDLRLGDDAAAARAEALSAFLHPGGDWHPGRLARALRLDARDPALRAGGAICAALAAAAVFDLPSQPELAARTRLRWSPLLVEILRQLLAADPARLVRARADAGRPDSPCRALSLSLCCAAERGFRPSLAPPWRMDSTYLAGCDLRGTELHSNFCDADMDAALLQDARLENCSAADASLHRARLDRAVCSGLRAPRLRARAMRAPHARFDHANLCEADLRGVDFDGAVLDDATLMGADLTGASFRAASLYDANLRHAVLRDADLSHADLRLADLRGLDLRPVRLVGARLAGAHLGGAQLAGTVHPRLWAPNARFEDADLTGARWRCADLRGARFLDAHLADVDWQGADLRGCDFRGAAFHLGSARSGLLHSPVACEGSRTGFYTDESLEQHFQAPEVVRKANLRGCDLRGAAVEGVDFYLVDLRGCRLDPAQREWLRRCRAILDPDGP
ncbi:MAG: pentapeptide repeat-containing protein [Planctomycetota bacterium]